MEELIDRFLASGLGHNLMQGTEWNSEEYGNAKSFTDMLNDHDRNKKYFAAIRRAVASKKQDGGKAIVLDIGCGTGIFAMMAVAAGADTVYACEVLPWKVNCAKKTFERNGFTDRINLINKRSTSLQIGKKNDMQTKANILVTEIFDSQLIGEEAILTFNHAHRFLLAPKCIVVPQSATIYASVIDSEYIRNLSSIPSIMIDEQRKIKFPEKWSNCSEMTNADMELQLSKMQPGKHFKKISNALKIFEFDWTNHSQQLIPSFRSSKVEFIANCDGTMDGVFFWWALLLDSKEESVISCAPAWAFRGSTGGPIWRYHWQQNVNYGMTSIPVKEGAQCFLESYHDTHYFWFKPTRLPLTINEGHVPKTRNIACICGAHISLGSDRMVMLNDTRRNEKFLTVLRHKIVPGKSVCLCLSDFTLLPIMANLLGAKLVLVYVTDVSVVEFLRIIMRENGIPLDQILFFNKSILPSNCKEVDLVFGDPFFLGMSLTEGEYPWHHFKFFTFYEQIEASNRLRLPKEAIAPYKARIMGMGVMFEELDRIKRRVWTVCDELDMTDYYEQFQGGAVNSRHNPWVIDCEYLWQYDCEASSKPFQIFAMETGSDSSRGAERVEGEFELKAAANGICLWVEWDLQEGTTISSGPTQESPVGNTVEWDMYSKQGIYFTPNLWNPDDKPVIRFTAIFNRTTQDANFTFV